MNAQIEKITITEIINRPGLSNTFWHVRVADKISKKFESAVAALNWVKSQKLESNIRIQEITWNIESEIGRCVVRMLTKES